MAEPQQQLCRLRQDLDLLPGPVSLNHTPTWTIHDQVSGQFFRIGWVAYELLSRWHLVDPAHIVTSVTDETTLEVHEHDVWHLDRFLRNNFLCIPEQGDTGRYDQIRKSRKTSIKKLWQTYLFLKFPLFRPDRFLNMAAPFFNWAFTKTFVLFASLLALLSLVLLSRHWEEFLTTFAYFFRPEGVVIYGVAIFLSKALHEFAHAITAKHYGLRVPTVGVALLVFWPLLYTDATESWRLTNRNQRMAIAGAGILSEIVLAAIAGILWVFLDEGPLKSVCFLLASANWITTIIFNLNPFMRFDGYFILSDLLNVENLQQRAFAYSKWRIYEYLFNFGDPPPEAITDTMRGPLLLYSLCTWTYRVFIIVSISLLVYHLFFKVLGIILLAVQLAKTVFLPSISGLKNLYTRRQDMRFSLKGTVAFALILVGGICLFLPLRGSISSQALLVPKEKIAIHAPDSGMLKQGVVERNKEVSQGELLFRIDSPRIHHAIDMNQIRRKKLEHELSVIGFHAKNQEQRLVYLAELEQLEVERQALVEERQALTITATISGIMELPPDFYSEGEWIEKGTLLGTLSRLGDYKIITYVSELQLHRIHVGETGYFAPALPGSSIIPATIVSIDEYALTNLQNPSFASTYKGSLPVKFKENQSMIPMGTYYKVTLVPTQPPGLQTARLQLEGSVRITAVPESLFVRAWKKIVGVIIRESVF